MSAKAIEVVRLQTTASYVFAADNARARAPFDQDVGVALAKEFFAADVVVQAGERPVWVARQGTCKFSEKRRIVCGSLIGSAHELTVSAEGPTEDAKDVLNELWSKLGEVTGESSVNMTDFPGVFVFGTTAIVRVPGGFDSAFPGINRVHECARAKLGKALVQRPDVVQFRIDIPVEFAVRGLNVRRSFVIEPRFTALTDDHIFFTVSPLNSNDHIEMLEQLCQASGATK